MPPKKATTATAAAKTKANTKAKVTKPAPEVKAKMTKPARAPPKAKAAAATKTKAAKAAPARAVKAAPAKATPAKAAKVAAPAEAKAPAKPKAAQPNGVIKAPAKPRGRPKKADAPADEPATKPKANAAANTKKATPAAAAPADKPSRKRKAEDDAPAPPAKKVKVLKKGAVINDPPSQTLHVYVFGEGTAGELGLGTVKNGIDVKRPRLNPHLAANTVGVVQLTAGGMHCIALTHDNKILTWGVNDQGTLGRDTTWDGGLKDMDAAAKANDDADDDDYDDNDNGLNPHESTPGEVDFSNTNVADGTLWVQVAAGDSSSFALTDDGRVYGWGTFRGNEGVFGFTSTLETANRPILIPDLKNIVSIKAGANHALALDTRGAVFAWGSGQQNQLGRRVVERTKTEGLKPREFGLPKGTSKNAIVSIETGAYHSFAIAKSGDVYAWGLNNFGETGIMDNAGQDDAVILKPQVVESLQGKKLVSLKGGSHHTLAATKTGECLAWGRIDGHQTGLADADILSLSADHYIQDEKQAPRILAVPTPVAAIEGEVVEVAASSDHSIAVTREGEAWSWGFSANYQTGQGQEDDVLVATKIDNTAVRGKKIVGASCGGQFSVLLALADGKDNTPVVVNGVKE